VKLDETTEIFALETGIFKLDGGAMFGTVPKVIWEKSIPADANNRIPMALRIVLIRDHKKKRNLLIDTGIGDKWTEKLASIYCIDHSQYRLDQSLAAHGLKPSDITDVVLTHLHFDHAGGATRIDSKKAKPVPSFPNARYYVQKDNYDWATQPNSRESASYLPENFVPLCESNQLTICDGVKAFEDAVKWEGLSVVLSYGHTIGLQCPLFRANAQQVFFYPSDMIPTSAHLPVPWVMGYDIHVIRLLDEKEKVLDQAAQENWILIYEHDPAVPATQVVRGPKHFSAGAKFLLN